MKREGVLAVALDTGMAWSALFVSAAALALAAALAPVVIAASAAWDAIAPSRRRSHWRPAR